MIKRFTSLFRTSPVTRAAAFAVEGLEGRVLLTTTASAVFGNPINLSASSAGITPQFDWLAPLVSNNANADLIVSNSNDTITVLQGNGDGSFQTPGAGNTYAVTGTPLPITTGQLVTGSSNEDIVVGTTGSPGGIDILIGNGDGTFQTPIYHSALGSNHAVSIGAFVDGGPQDIVSIDNTASTQNNIGISYTDGNGNITSFQTLSAGHGGLAALAVGNFGNGHEDIAVLSQTDSTVTVFLGNGNGTFGAPTDYKTGSSPTSIAVGDFNGDGKLDLVTANSTAGTVSFLAGNGNGTFAAKLDTAVTGSAAGGGPLKVRVANFTNNGKADLLCLLSPGGTGDATILLGQGNGTFQNIKPISTGGGTRTGLAVGDLNGDGLTDIVLSNSSEVTSLLNKTVTDTSTPTATVNPGTSGSSQSSVYSFTVTYTDSQQIDAQTIGNNNLIVTAPAGVVFPGESTTAPATLVSTNLVSGPSVTATYQIAFPGNMTSADNGTYTVSINPNSVSNAGSVFVPGGTIGTFTLNVSSVVIPPPTAAVNPTQAVASTSDNFYQFTVTYNDATQVNAASLGDGNLVVIAPTGVTLGSGSGTEAATLISQNLTSAASLQATYQIAFPSNISSADQGSYVVSMNANSVINSNGIPVAQGSIGTFNLSLTPVIVAPTGDFTPIGLKGKIKPSVVGGAKQTGVSVTLVNTSGHIITGANTVTVNLNASNSQYVTTGTTSTVLMSAVHKFKNLKPGKSFVVHFKPFNYPATAGTYYLVANAALNGTLDSYDLASSPIVDAAAFVDVQANSATPGKSAVTAGVKNSATLNVTNLGNVSLIGAATVNVYELLPGGTQTQIATTTAKLHLTAGQAKNVKFSYVPATLPASGSGNIVFTIAAPGDTNSANNTVATLSTVLFS